MDMTVAIKTLLESGNVKFHYRQELRGNVIKVWADLPPWVKNFIKDFPDKVQVPCDVVVYDWGRSSGHVVGIVSKRKIIGAHVWRFYVDNDGNDGYTFRLYIAGRNGGMESAFVASTAEEYYAKLNELLRQDI